MTKAVPKLNEIAAAATAVLAPLGLRELPRDSHGWVRRWARTWGWKIDYVELRRPKDRPTLCAVDLQSLIPGIHGPFALRTANLAYLARDEGHYSLERGIFFNRDPVARIAGDLAKVADAFFYETATPALAKSARDSDPQASGDLHRIENDRTRRMCMQYLDSLLDDVPAPACTLDVPVALGNESLDELFGRWGLPVRPRVEYAME